MGRPLSGIAVFVAAVAIGAPVAAQDVTAREGALAPADTSAADATTASGDDAPVTAGEGMVTTVEDAPPPAVAPAAAPPDRAVDAGERVAPSVAPSVTAPDDTGPHWGRVRARVDAIFSWAPRYRLQTSADPLGLEQAYWRQVEMLALYHRVGLDATYAIDEATSVSLHFSGWGSLNLLADAGGGVAAGDVAIGYVELAARPVEAWLGRRFLPYGPPGGLHVDGGGAAIRSSFGLYADAFVGRPVTPVRTTLQGPEPSFEGAGVAYGARVGWSEPGTFSAAASYAELWGGGLPLSRTIDVTVTGDPGPLHLDGGVKFDLVSLGVMHASLGASVQVVRELSMDATYLHVEPGRWIPAYSILSVFETSTFDEASAGATLRATRALAFRLELAGRLYSHIGANEPSLGYRADLTVRLAPAAEHDPSVRALVSRRDDGTLGYTLLEVGAAIEPVAQVVVALDGALAVDDSGGRLSTIGRASVDGIVDRTFMLGGTIALARTPFAESEVRAMVRARWTPEAE